jgi:hypothetical protein
MNEQLRTNRVTMYVAALAATAAAALALVVPGGHSASAEHSHAASHGHAAPHSHAPPHSAALNARQLAFHDEMRRLWEDHIVWTRMAIVSFAAGSPDFDATAARLLQNQVDIGNAIKPFYGEQAGQQLTDLLQEHITGAVVLLEAAKSGDSDAFEQAKAAWYENGDRVARFLSDANPENWKFGVVASMMRTHLDQTLSEAAHRLAGEFEADIRDYDAIHRHILEMADTLSSGIIAQFPKRFR